MVFLYSIYSGIKNNITITNDDVIILKWNRLKVSLIYNHKKYIIIKNENIKDTVKENDINSLSYLFKIFQILCISILYFKLKIVICNFHCLHINVCNEWCIFSLKNSCYFACNNTSSTSCVITDWFESTLVW